jgi:uncharacterized membrane protein YfcA
VIDPRFSLAGLIVGVLVGVSGIGGSSILAPVLILLLGMKPSLAIATDLLYSVPTKVFAVVLHQRQKNVDWLVTRRLLAGGVPGALGGLALYAWLRGHIEIGALERGLRHGIGFAILIALAATTLLWFVRDRRPESVRAAANSRTAATLVIATGVLVGFLVALTSIGSGSVTLPLLVITLPTIALRRLIGAEIAFAAFLIPIAALGHASIGEVDAPAVASLLIGSIPGVFIGARLCTVLDERWMRPVIFGTLAFAGSRLL